MVIVIGISGKARSGKDEICKYIISIFPSSTRLAFADPLKKEVAKACGVTVEFIEQNKELFRPMLQWYGTDFRRKLYGENYWIKQWGEAFLNTTTQVVIVPDVRFVDEALHIQEIGGYLLRVERPTSIVDEHPSETQLDNYKHFNKVITNNKSIILLQQEVDIALEMLHIK